MSIRITTEWSATFPSPEALIAMADEGSRLDFVDDWAPQPITTPHEALEWLGAAFQAANATSQVVFSGRGSEVAMLVIWRGDPDAGTSMILRSLLVRHCGTDSEPREPSHAELDAAHIEAAEARARADRLDRVIDNLLGHAHRIIKEATEDGDTYLVEVWGEVADVLAEPFQPDEAPRKAVQP